MVGGRRVTGRNVEEAIVALRTNDPTWADQIHLHRRGLSESVCCELFRALGRNTIVKTLDLCQVHVSTSTLRAEMVDMLVANHNNNSNIHNHGTLQVLSLEIPLISSDWREIGNDLIRRGSKIRLKWLKCRSELYVNEQSQDLEVLANLFERHPNFAQGLELVANPSTELNQKYFFRSILASSIKSLMLATLRGNSFDLAVLGEALQATDCQLRKLEIESSASRDHEGSRQVERFLSCLESNTSLESLTLIGVIPSFGAIRYRLPLIPNLQEFRLYHQIGHFLCLDLNLNLNLDVSALAAMPYLTRINLERVGASLLENTLRCLRNVHRRLEHLRLIWDVSEDEWVASSEPLKELATFTVRAFVPEAFTGVRKLTMELHGFGDRNGFDVETIPPGGTDVVYKALCSALKDNSSIRTIRLCSLEKTDDFAGLKLLANELLPTLPHLESFSSHEGTFQTADTACLTALLEGARCSHTLHHVIINGSSIDDDFCWEAETVDLVDELRFLFEKNRIGFPIPLLLSKGEGGSSTRDRKMIVETTSRDRSCSTRALWPFILCGVRRLDVLYLLLREKLGELVPPSQLKHGDDQNIAAT